MSQLFITSDLHLGHRNIIRYESRPFGCVEEMDRELVRRWNKKIAPGDRVIFLGDFALRNVAFIEEILSQLNYGIMIWIKGNHDKGVNTLNKFERVFATKRMVLPLRGLGQVLLTHEPDYAYESNEIDINLHGHVHGREGGDVIRRDGLRWWFHVGIDTNNLRPWHLSEMAKALSNFAGDRLHE
jgi:calcineurin-like phosphoesterase family protein